MNDLFPSQEYRGYVSVDNSVKATFPSSKALVIDTQFDTATATALSAAILASTKNAALSYTITLDGIIDPDDMKNAMKRVVLSIGSISNYTAKITSIRVDWAKQETTLTVRGVA